MNTGIIEIMEKEKPEIEKVQAEFVLEDGRTFDDIKAGSYRGWKVDGQVFNTYWAAVNHIAKGKVCECGKTTNERYRTSCEECSHKQTKENWEARETVDFVEPGMMYCLHHDRYFSDFENIDTWIDLDSVDPDMLMLVPCDTYENSFNLCDNVENCDDGYDFCDDSTYDETEKAIQKLIDDFAKKYPVYYPSSKGRIEYGQV